NKLPRFLSKRKILAASSRKKWVVTRAPPTEMSWIVQLPSRSLGSGDVRACYAPQIEGSIVSKLVLGRHGMFVAPQVDDAVVIAAVVLDHVELLVGDRQENVD